MRSLADVIDRYQFLQSFGLRKTPMRLGGYDTSKHDERNR
jgi:hypothetical protein